MRILSDRARGWLRSLLADDEDEPKAPSRLREEVIAFANFQPKAMRREWVDFATEFAEECWKAGFVAGRDGSDEEAASDDLPEAIADMVDPTWRDRPWDPDAALIDPAGEVPEKRTDAQIVEEQVAKLMAKPRRF